MKKNLLTLSLILAFGFTQAQVLLTQNFDVFPPVGWTTLNNSVPVGTTGWFGGAATFPSQAGVPLSYIAANFNNTTGDNTISNWLITPSVSLVNGDVISFWTRQVTNNIFPDNLEMRIGSGATIADPAGVLGLGGYTTLAIEINPALTAAGYPSVWTEYTHTVTGLPVATNTKVAFRYFVPNGGPAGNNSNLIGVDTFSITRTLSTENFFTSNFSIHPNPVKDVLNVTAKNGVAIDTIQVLDINGRVVNQVNASSETVQINVSELNAGVYFVKVQSELGVGTSKIIKN